MTTDTKPKKKRKKPAVTRILEKLEDMEADRQELQNKLAKYEEEERSREFWERYGWTRPRVIEDDLGLPVPRLQMTWEVRSNEHEHAQVWLCRYDLIYSHLCDHLMAVPMGFTQRGPMSSRPDSYSEIDKPFRDYAHACSDALHLNLPLYVVCGEKIEEIDPKKHAGALNSQKDRIEKKGYKS